MDNSEKLNYLPDLKTQRLVLRKIKLSDAEDMFEYASDPVVAKYTTWTAHQSIEHSKRFVNKILEFYNTHQLTVWGIVDTNGKFIGTCGFGELQLIDARAELGYALSRKYWGKGYMTEAVTAVINFGFSNMPLNRIEARCEPENIASLRVLEKVGMKYEGLLRQHIYSKGTYHDLKIYSILKQELPDTKTTVKAYI
ncbi:MAG: GNAT family N-acetyltransferase [Crinalium sp.]